MRGARRNGSMLLAVTVLSFTLLGLGTVLAQPSLEAMRSAQRAEARAEAQALADAGLEAALARLATDPSAADPPPAALGRGTYRFRIERQGDGYRITTVGTVPSGGPARETRRLIEADAAREPGGAARVTRYQVLR